MAGWQFHPSSCRTSPTREPVVCPARLIFGCRYFDISVGSGEVACITGVTRNPAQAVEVGVPFGPFSPTSFNGTADVLSARLLARIGTTDSGGFCGGHSNAAGLRLYLDAISRASRFDVRFVD